MKNNFDNSEEMANLKKRLTGEKWKGECVEEIWGENVKKEVGEWTERCREMLIRGEDQTVYSKWEEGMWWLSEEEW